MKRIEFLGTGTSTGVPVIRCSCPVCTSEDPADRRLRSSLFLQGRYTRLLVDTSPDFREQALRSSLEGIDFVFVTHSHNDHVAGLDDLRIFNFIQKREIPLYSDRQTLRAIRTRFPYIFQKTQTGGGKPKLELREIRFFEEVTVGEFTLMSVPVRHGDLTINGYVIDGSVAYLTDCSGIPPETEKILRNVPTVILGAVKDRPHPTHFSFEEAREALERIGCERAFFTHISQDLSHRELTERYGPRITIPADGDQFTYKESPRGVTDGKASASQ